MIKNTFKTIWNSCCQNSWVIGFFLFGVFLLTNGYIYGWDDQHLEIPLLKSLIDPTLYAGDYYVESLKTHFSSLLYPLLAKILTVKQIPTAYFCLYLVSRYVLLMMMYLLWRQITEKKSVAVLAVLTLLSVGRVEEFLYRTFSHQEFALAIMMAGMVLFYKDRFVWAAASFGLAANFHSLYSLYPFLYMLTFLLRDFKHQGGRVIFKSSALFMLAASPLLFWVSQRPAPAAGPVLTPSLNEWWELYQLSCPQNFIFPGLALRDVISGWTPFWNATQPYWLLGLLYVLNRTFNPEFNKDKKTQSALLAGTLLLIISFVFTYVLPQRFILDLNLVRNTQFMLFFLFGYTMVLLFNASKQMPSWSAALMGGLLPLFRFGGTLSCLSLLTILGLLWFAQAKDIQDRRRSHQTLWSLALVSGTIIAIAFQFNWRSYSITTLWMLILTWTALASFLGLAIISKNRQLLLKPLFIWIPIIGVLVHFTFYHYERAHVERTGSGGYWQLNKAWIDMQNHVRENTPKDALLLVPYNMTMGGFRIFSERKIICSYRDCGIIGFDYPAAQEWQRRVKDIESFKVFVTGDITPAIERSMTKYRVQYIVFMNYIAPAPNPVVQLVYRNDIFSLYRVQRPR